MGLAFIPLYIRHMGMEAWGLVGFFSIMQAWLVLLDIGLSPTLNREMARFSAGANSAQSIRNLLRSLEVVYGGIAVMLVLIVWLAAPSLVRDWLQLDNLPVDKVVDAINVMGLVLAARMSEQVYRGALQGLQRHIWLNAAQAMLATIRWGGAAAVLVWISPSIEAFFLWQGLVSLAAVGVFATHTYRCLPTTQYPGHFDLSELKRIHRFAGGMAAGTLLALILTQVDKLMLSKLLTLEQFGYYALAVAVAGALSFLVAPISTSVAPRFTEILTRDEHSVLVTTYHGASQWMAVMVIPAALMMAFFPERLLWVWSGDTTLADTVAPLLVPLALGAMCNAFMHVPHMAQLAYGWTSLGVRVNLFAIAVTVPTIFLVVPIYGAAGAAWTWFALNASYVAIGIHFMHRKVLQREKSKWYVKAIIQPLVVGICAAGALKVVQPVTDSRLGTVLALAVISGIVTILVAVSTPEPRLLLQRQLVRLRGGSTND